MPRQNLDFKLLLELGLYFFIFFFALGSYLTFVDPPDPWEVQTIALDWSPDRQNVVSFHKDSKDNKIFGVIWDVSEKEEVVRLDKIPRSICVDYEIGSYCQEHVKTGNLLERKVSWDLVNDQIALNLLEYWNVLVWDTTTGHFNYYNTYWGSLSELDSTCHFKTNGELLTTVIYSSAKILTIFKNNVPSPWVTFELTDDRWASTNFGRPVWTENGSLLLSPYSQYSETGNFIGYSVWSFDGVAFDYRKDVKIPQNDSNTHTKTLGLSVDQNFLFVRYINQTKHNIGVFDLKKDEYTLLFAEDDIYPIEVSSEGSKLAFLKYDFSLGNNNSYHIVDLSTQQETNLSVESTGLRLNSLPTFNAETTEMIYNPPQTEELVFFDIGKGNEEILNMKLTYGYIPPGTYMLVAGLLGVIGTGSILVYLWISNRSSDQKQRGVDDLTKRDISSEVEKIRKK